MSHIMMRVSRWELALIVRAPTVNSNDDSKDFLVASREIGLEVNSEKNKYIGKGM